MQYVTIYRRNVTALKFCSFSEVAAARLVYFKGRGISTPVQHAQIHLRQAAIGSKTVVFSNLHFADYVKKNTEVVLARPK